MQYIEEEKVNLFTKCNKFEHSDHKTNDSWGKNLLKFIIFKCPGFALSENVRVYDKPKFSKPCNKSLKLPCHVPFLLTILPILLWDRGYEFKSLKH